MKKLLIRAVSGMVLDVLIEVAKKQREKFGMTETHYDRWTTVVAFLQDMRVKGLPL